NDPNSDPKSDFFVLKFSSYGAYLWHNIYETGGHNYAEGIATESGGSVYVTGNSDTTWGAPLKAHSNGINSDLFVLKLATICPDHAVMIEGKTPYYTTLHDAYREAAADDSILIQAMKFTEDLSLDGNDVTLRGGYECGFASNPGRSTIKGTLTISGGTVTIENIVIQ
ncbi:MAG TPA: hypothetical protein VMB78_01460, partial [Dissulfurispiraceae bacterium]|nr:hypothetical protein [Dissulfurispiraceae bacterium]